MGSLITDWESRTASTDDDLSTASPYYRTYDLADATAFLGPSTSDVIRNDGACDANDVTYEPRAPPSSTENNYAEISNQDGVNTINPGGNTNANASGQNKDSRAQNPSILNSNFTFRPRYNQFTDKSTDVTFDQNVRLGSTGSDDVTSSTPQTASSALSFKSSTPFQSIPQCTVSTIPVPLNTRRSQLSADSSVYQYGSAAKTQKNKSVLHTAIVMSIAGLVYIAIGIIAGYFIFRKNCPEQITSKSCALKEDRNTTEISEISPSVQFTQFISSSTTPTTSVSTDTAIPSESPISSCTTEENRCKCGPFGGNSERTFNDSQEYQQHGNITSFVVNHNEYFIGSIQFWYGKTAGPQHGYTTSGYEVKVDLAHNEIITDVYVDLTSGKPFLTRLQINTNLRVFGPYGGRAGEQMATQGGRLLYIAGRAGAMIDQMVLYYSKCNE